MDAVDKDYDEATERDFLDYLYNDKQHKKQLVIAANDTTGTSTWMTTSTLSKNMPGIPSSIQTTGRQRITRHQMSCGMKPG